MFLRLIPLIKIIINVIPQGFYVIEQGLWLMWLTVYFESDSPSVFALSDVTTPFNFY